MNTIALVLALFVSNSAHSVDRTSQAVQPVREGAGIVKVQIQVPHTERKAHLRPHTVSAPMQRSVLETLDAEGCVVRTLAGDSSGQLVRECN